MTSVTFTARLTLKEPMVASRPQNEIAPRG
jgi:hypothetical protein